MEAVTLHRTEKITPREKLSPRRWMQENIHPYFNLRSMFTCFYAVPTMENDNVKAYYHGRRANTPSPISFLLSLVLGVIRMVQNYIFSESKAAQG